MTITFDKMNNLYIEKYNPDYDTFYYFSRPFFSSCMIDGEQGNIMDIKLTQTRIEEYLNSNSLSSKESILACKRLIPLLKAYERRMKIKTV